VAFSFIGWGNRSAQRKPPTCRKSRTNFMNRAISVYIQCKYYYIIIEELLFYHEKSTNVPVFSSRLYLRSLFDISTWNFIEYIVFAYDNKNILKLRFVKFFVYCVIVILFLPCLVIVEKIQKNGSWTVSPNYWTILLQSGLFPVTIKT
jgi:hypothetical protein